MRKPSSKKGATIGSGGQRRAGLKGKGPTPKAVDRDHHPAARRARRAERRDPRDADVAGPAGTVVVGRNSVVEVLRAGAPATALYVQVRVASDDRLREALRLAEQAALPIYEGSRTDLDGLAHHSRHQGLVLTMPEFGYCDISDLTAGDLLVFLDGITDTHNLGAIARSAVAFGASGLVLPSRRSAHVTASAWKSSAGALARLGVAKVPNLRSALENLHADGWMSIGLVPQGDQDVRTVCERMGPERVALVVGSEIGRAHV